MVTTGETLGLAEWIIDDTCLVFIYLLFTLSFSLETYKLSPLEDFSCSFQSRHISNVRCEIHVQNGRVSQNIHSFYNLILYKYYRCQTVMYCFS